MGTELVVMVSDTNDMVRGIDSAYNVALFDLILYVQVNNFSVMSGRVILG